MGNDKNYLCGFVGGISEIAFQYRKGRVTLRGSNIRKMFHASLRNSGKTVGVLA